MFQDKKTNSWNTDFALYSFKEDAIKRFNEQTEVVLHFLYREQKTLLFCEIVLQLKCYIPFKWYSRYLIGQMIQIIEDHTEEVTLPNLMTAFRSHLELIFTEGV